MNFSADMIILSADIDNSISDNQHDVEFQHITNNEFCSLESS